MAYSEKSTKDQSQLLADARQAGKDALETILNLLPEEEEPQSLQSSPGWLIFWTRL